MAKLGQHARDTIKMYGAMSQALDGPRITIAGYVRHYFGDSPWGGDECGCPDNRRIGYHNHDSGYGCGCLEVTLDQYAAALRTAGANQ